MFMNIFSPKDSAYISITLRCCDIHIKGLNITQWETAKDLYIFY